MGGSIALESAPGAGTTVRIALDLPVATAPDVSRPPGAPLLEARARRPRGDTRPILVVDDNEFNRSVLVKQVAALGYAAEQVGDGEEALRMWRSHDYALVLADCQMPGMDGFAFARAVRAEEAGRPGGVTRADRRLDRERDARRRRSVPGGGHGRRAGQAVRPVDRPARARDLDRREGSDRAGNRRPAGGERRRPRAPDRPRATAANHERRPGARAGDARRVPPGRLSRGMPDDLQDFARFAYLTGWRRGELQTLGWADVDRTHGRIRLRREHSKTASRASWYWSASYRP